MPGCRVEISGATGKPVRMISIIGIKDTDKIAIFRQLKPPSQSGVGSLILLYDQMNSRIIDGANNFNGVIPGTVIDNHHSLRRKGLPQNGTNGFVDNIAWLYDGMMQAIFWFIRQWRSCYQTPGQLSRQSLFIDMFPSNYQVTTPSWRLRL